MKYTPLLLLLLVSGCAAAPVTPAPIPTPTISPSSNPVPTPTVTATPLAMPTSNSGPPSPVPPERVERSFGTLIELAIRQQIAVFPDGLELTYSELNDSRCPIGATCVQAGQAEVSLQVDADKSEILKLNFPADATQAQVSWNGYLFTVYDVSPRSVIGNAEGITPRRVTLFIRVDKS